MTTAIGFGILVVASVVLSWLAEEVLPRRPTGGLKGLIVLALVSGFFLGWVAEAVRIGFGPSPGGVNLAAGMCGSVGAILAISLQVLFKAWRGRP